MTQQIPSRPPYRDDEYPRHTSEREGDGMAPVYILRHEHVGTDGLTDDQRVELGRKYAEGPGRKALSDREKADIKAHLAAKRAEQPSFMADPTDPADVPDLADLGDRPPTLVAVPSQASSVAGLAALRHRATRAVEDSPAASGLLDRVAAVAAEQTAVAREQESGVPNSLDNAIAAFDDGERSGVAIGLRKAAQRAERFKGLAVEKGDVDTAAAFDEFIRELVEVANHG